MSDYAAYEGKSLDDIVKENRQARSKAKGPMRRAPKTRDSPLSSGRSDGHWKHDKHDEAVAKERPTRPPMTEAERGYKVKVSNSPLNEEEFKVLLDGSELKKIIALPQKKMASIFFAQKEDADRAISDFHNTELLNGFGQSEWVYVPWEERPPREPRQPKQKASSSSPSSSAQNNSGRNRRGPRTTAGGSKINPKDIVISVRR